MAELGATVTGVDPAARNILIARQHAQQSKLDIEYLEGSIEVVAGRCFDVVLNMEVVEHVEDLKAFMSACNRAVAPGGLEIVATLNRNIRSFVFAILGAEYILGWLPKGTHQWRKFVTPTELKRLLAADALQTFDQAGVSVNPFTRAYRVSKDTRVNYMLLATRHA
jgi:2-polyprenyl-6-hydroxyphenyl methylase/3-demethylubiquinone-9 3-methyltransferase